MLPNLKEKEIASRSYGSHSKIYVSVTPFCVLVCVPPLKNASDIIFKVKVPLFATAVDLGPHCYIWAWVLSKHHLNIASLRIGKHRIAKKGEHRPSLVQIRLSGRRYFSGNIWQLAVTLRWPCVKSLSVLCKIFSKQNTKSIIKTQSTSRDLYNL